MVSALAVISPNAEVFGSATAMRMARLGSASWNETAVARLAELRPEVYGEWEPDELTAAFKRHGVRANRQIWGTDEHGTGRNRRGFHRADVAETHTQRDSGRGAG